MATPSWVTSSGSPGNSLGAGTLYQVLARLERKGLIEALEPQERRRPYRLTGAGASALRIHLAGLAKVVQAGQGRLGMDAP